MMEQCVAELKGCIGVVGKPLRGCLRAAQSMKSIPGHPRIVEHELYALGETGFASTGEPVDRIDRDKGDSTLRRLQPMQQEVYEAKVRIVAQRDFEAVGGSGTFTAADVLARHEI